MKRFASLSCILFLVLITALVVPVRAGDQPTTSTLRILSLAPNATEMLFALGAEDQIVGVTDFCEYPPAAKSKPHIGGLYDARIESILALRPNVVFHLPASSGLLVEMQKRGIETIEVPSETLADVRAGIVKIGGRVGRKERARELVAKIDEQLAAVQKNVAGKAKPSVLIVVGHPPGILREVYAAGPDTYLDDLIAICGGTNTMHASPVRYPVIARETVMQQPPDVVIEFKPAGETWTDKERGELKALWLDYLGPAGKKARVVALDDSHLTIPGPAVGEQAGVLAKLIHPE